MIDLISGLILFFGGVFCGWYFAEEIDVLLDNFMDPQL